MNVGEKIRYLREKRNWSQLFLAEKVGINNSVLSRIEAGKRDVEDYLLSKIADVLEVSTDYLLGRTDDPTLYQKPGRVNRSDDTKDDLDEEIQRILEDPETEIFFKDYLSAPEEKKKQLRDFLRFLLEEEKRNNKK